MGDQFRAISGAIDPLLGKARQDELPRGVRQSQFYHRTLRGRTRSLSEINHRTMYTLAVRDSIMIAHSFTGGEFGPAQEMHGATYTVDAEFQAPELQPKVNWVVDIGAASEILGNVLKKYNFKNLNDLAELKGQNTTTEFMCKKIHEGICEDLNGQFKGTLKVTLAESHKAWASFTGIVAE